MRICYICNEYPPDSHGGIGAFVKDMAECLRDCGHEVWVVGYSDRDSFGQEDGITVVRIKLPVWRGKYLGFFKRRWYFAKIIGKLSREHGFELIETPEVEGEMAFWKIVGARNKLLVVRYHNSETTMAKMKEARVSPLVKLAERLTIGSSPYKIAVSNHIRRYSVKCFGAVADTETVIYNFVDSDVFRPVEGISRDSNRILYVGRVAYFKGIGLLFRELPAIFESLPHVYLDVVGSDCMEAPGGGKLVDYLITQLPERYRSRVNYLGRVERSLLPEIYSGAGCCVFPSLVEAHSVAWLEAMSCGCACVLSEVAAGREYVKNYDSALVCDPRKVGEFSENVIRLLSDDDLSDRVGLNARLEVLDRFDRKKAVAVNLDFYNQLLISRQR